MKIFPLKKLQQTRVNTEDSLGHGMDAAVLMALFFLAGFGLDRLFDTQPVFMVIMSLVGAVGIFTTFKYRYLAKMDEHDTARRKRSAAAGIRTGRANGNLVDTAQVETATGEQAA